MIEQGPGFFDIEGNELYELLSEVKLFFHWKFWLPDFLGRFSRENLHP